MTTTQVQANFLQEEALLLFTHMFNSNIQKDVGRITSVQKKLSTITILDVRFSHLSVRSIKS